MSDKLTKTPEILDALFAGIKSGKSTREICMQLGVNQRSLWNWFATDGDLMRKYLSAKELSADARIKEIKKHV